MISGLNILSEKKPLATVKLSGKQLTAESSDRTLERQLAGFLIQCSAKGIHTFLEPKEMKKGEITIIEAVVFPGERGFLPALVRRLRYIVPGAEIEFVDPDAEVNRARNVVRHELASLPADKTLQPAIRQIMGTVDKLSLGQAKEALAILQEKESDAGTRD